MQREGWHRMCRPGGRNHWEPCLEGVYHISTCSHQHGNMALQGHRHSNLQFIFQKLIYKKVVKSEPDSWRWLSFQRHEDGAKIPGETDWATKPAGGSERSEHSVWASAAWQPSPWPATRDFCWVSPGDCHTELLVFSILRKLHARIETMSQQYFT